ncbi:hypothetical protein D3C71_1745600 [compost metagenome]
MVGGGFHQQEIRFAQAAFILAGFAHQTVSVIKTQRHVAAGRRAPALFANPVTGRQQRCKLRIFGHYRFPVSKVVQQVKLRMI